MVRLEDDVVHFVHHVPFTAMIIYLVFFAGRRWNVSLPKTSAVNLLTNDKLYTINHLCII